MTALTKLEPADGALVAFGPLGEVYAVYQRIDAAGFPSGTCWLQVGDDNGAPLTWLELLRSHIGDAGPHLLTFDTEPVNDIEATGHCCCNGCIGEGLCDLDLGRRDDDYYAEATP